MRFVVLFLACLLICSCEGDISIDYEFTNLEIEHAENTGDAPVVNELDSIPAEAYVLRLNLFPVEISRSRGRYMDSETPPRNMNWVDSIRVSANIDFDAEHPAGSSLNDFFVIFNHNYFYTSSLDDAYITNKYSPIFYDEPLPNYADLLLMSPPQESDDFIFTVYVELHDGSYFEKSTESIRIYK